jgi:flagellar biosynthesis component FlhA
VKCSQLPDRSRLRKETNAPVRDQTGYVGVFVALRSISALPHLVLCMLDDDTLAASSVCNKKKKKKKKKREEKNKKKRKKEKKKKDVIWDDLAFAAGLMNKGQSTRQSV